jgi:hypothetical protein
LSKGALYLQYLSPFAPCKGYSTLETHENEVLIPPELLSGRSVLTPDRQFGNFIVFTFYSFWLITHLFLKMLKQ